MSSTQYTPEIISRFYAKVSKIPTAQGCLEWLAYRNRLGYGAFALGDRRPHPAHRVAWEIVNGLIPPGLVVRHFICNNPRCCNVDHLRLGTKADNTHDIKRSGRWRNAPKNNSPYVRPTQQTAAERFYAKVSKIPTEAGCLDWKAYRNANNGYGYFKVNGITVLAHRFAWELVNGPVPDGLFCLHKCDRRSCCNPAHLFLGTHDDNAHDRKTKGRNGNHKGTTNGSVKLTETEILEMRSAKYTSWTHLAIAEHFGIGSSQVGRILRREAWKHI
jgi:hypothetical protein